MVVSLVVLIVFVGALTRATFGFGEALVAMPLLALLPIGLPTAASLIAIVSLTLAVIGIVGGSGQVDRKVLLRLCLGAVLGVPLGVALVLLVPERAVAAALGCFLVGYGWYAATSHRPAGTAPLEVAWPVGVVAGGLGSAYGFHGIPVVVYGTRRGWSPAMFRETLHVFFLVAGVLVVSGQAIGGLWSDELPLLVAVSLPVVGLAALLGRALHARIPVDRFQRSVHLLVLVLGVVLLTRAVLS
ncbi:sulfite exporter TauE/SafE family protein [Nocardioides mesophilus]|uniref:Probable membrane transporter protein n=1 Tax=Nocardioides mesophilus TaxID=433659 RepID=A0A7G9RE92_9ACTN|nr:sulfite exporter TauE/SafE family protein [Nocardioides mesophilus]QNN53917.1 sulfite exporter TauE/SafE family protein [Nocardioides mesophilus]